MKIIACSSPTISHYPNLMGNLTNKIQIYRHVNNTAALSQTSLKLSFLCCYCRKIHIGMATCKSCRPVLVQRPAVELPGQLGVELWLISVLYWVCGQLLTVKACLNHQTQLGTLGEVTTWRQEGQVKKTGEHIFLLTGSKQINDHQSWVIHRKVLEVCARFVLSSSHLIIYLYGVLQIAFNE